MPDLQRFTLANGLRVVLAPDGRMSRVAVCVHYRVGFRSERPGEEGLAHLFEHLMFRGSQSLPDGRFYDHIHALGGIANGTTHQDYTDYYQVVPSAGLGQALFAEADRMRAPRFTPESVAEQIIGVGLEIEQQTVDRPFGGFPWPLLPGLMFTRFANSHDGYGSLEQLRSVDADVCAAFFDRHYSPGQAVLTVTGGFDPDRARTLIDRYFAPIRSRAIPPRPELDEPMVGPGRVAEYSEPGVPVAAAVVGLPVAGYDQDPRGYLSRMVYGQLVAANGLPGAAAARCDVSAGFFGPLDALTPDVMLIVSTLPPGTSVDRMIEAIEASARRWSSGTGPDRGDLDRTIAELAGQLRRSNAELLARGRGLGRFEALYGAAAELDRIPDRLLGIDSDDIAATAAAVLTAPKTVLVLTPGATRSRPAAAIRAVGPILLDRTAGAPDAHRLAHHPAGPQTAPTLEPARPLPLTIEVDVLHPSGDRVLLVQRPGEHFLEVSGRWPLTGTGWARPELVQAMIDRLRHDDRTPPHSADVLEVDTDGQWLEISGRFDESSVQQWFDRLGDVLAGIGSPAGESAVLAFPPVLRRPFALADHAYRRATVPAHLLDAELPLVGREPGALVVVGHADPERLSRSALAALDRWDRPASGVDTDRESTVDPVPGVRRVSTAAGRGGGHVDIVLSAVDGRPRMQDPARYLATAVLGGYARSRLAQNWLDQSTPDYRVFAGYDLIGPVFRSAVRATVPVDRLDAALGDIARGLSGVVERPLLAAEVAPARLYCAAQIHAAADSPSAIAGMVRHVVTTGSTPKSLAEFPDRLMAVPLGEVARAAAELIPTAAASLVLTGDLRGWTEGASSDWQVPAISTRLDHRHATM